MRLSVLSFAHGLESIEKMKTDNNEGENNMSVPKKNVKKAVRESDNQLIDAAAQNAPAPEAVPAPAPVPNPIAQTDPALVPPQPGMIPTGWMFPADSAQSVAMETGDANLAAAAPGGGVVGGAPITNEEAQLVTEYRKWRKAKRINELKAHLKAKLREDEFEDTEDSIEEEPIADMEDTGLEDELDEGDEILDEVKDIAIDINTLFADLGGDPDELQPEAEDIESEPEIAEPPVEEDDVAAEDLKEARRKQLKARIAELRDAKKSKTRLSLHERLQKKLKESELAQAVDIKWPAGTPPIGDEAAADAPTKIQAYEKKIQARRALLKELRTREAEQSDYSLADPDETIEDSVGDVIDEVMPNQKTLESKEARSAVVQEASARKPRSEQFVERYNSKKSLNFKELLERGLLG